jgi:hypothetical protein
MRFLRRRYHQLIQTRYYLQQKLLRLRLHQTQGRYKHHYRHYFLEKDLRLGYFLHHQ